LDGETNILDNNGFLGDTEIRVTESNRTYNNTAGNNFPLKNVIYKLKTPAKTTTSFAYIFENKGLISIDYVYKNYRTMKLSNGFPTENQFLRENLRDTHTVNIGSEWRFKAWSIRGGYQYKQSPYKNALNSDNSKGYSLGAGYTFRNTRFDLAYQNKSHTEAYTFYPQYTTINAADLNIDNRVITATLTFNL
jgi:hypothetical protein